MRERMNRMRSRWLRKETRRRGETQEGNKENGRGRE